MQIINRQNQRKEENIHVPEPPYKCNKCICVGVNIVTERRVKKRQKQIASRLVLEVTKSERMEEIGEGNEFEVVWVYFIMR